MQIVYFLPYLLHIEASFLDLHFPLEVVVLPGCCLVLRTLTSGNI